MCSVSHIDGITISTNDEIGIARQPNGQTLEITSSSSSGSPIIVGKCLSWTERKQQKSIFKLICKHCHTELSSIHKFYVNSIHVLFLINDIDNILICFFIKMLGYYFVWFILYVQIKFGIYALISIVPIICALSKYRFWTNWFQNIVHYWRIFTFSDRNVNCEFQNLFAYNLIEHMATYTRFTTTFVQRLWIKII